MESRERARPFPTLWEQLREELGLNRPLVGQYAGWLWDMVRGDMGESLLTGRSVGAELLHRFPITAQLALMATFLGVGLGVPLGIFTAVRQDSWGDYLGRLWAIFLLGVPGFWLGLLVLLVGVRYFDWIPPVGYHALWDDPKSNLLQLIFPALILGSHQMALFARMTRSSMLEVLREDFIRTARAKGLREQLVVCPARTAKCLGPHFYARVPQPWHPVCGSGGHGGGVQHPRSGIAVAGQPAVS